MPLGELRPGAGLPVDSAQILSVNGVSSADGRAASPTAAITLHQTSTRLPTAGLVGVAVGGLLLMLVAAAIIICCYSRLCSIQAQRHRSQTVVKSVATAAELEQQGRQTGALDLHPPAAPAQSIAELKGRLGALAVHQPVLPSGSRKFYRGCASMRSCSEETEGLEHAHSKVAAALSEMSATGKLLAGRYLIDAESLSRKGATLLAACQDSYSSADRRLTAKFFLREVDRRNELAVRSLLPPQLLVTGVVASYGSGAAAHAEALPSCFITEAGNYSLEDWMTKLEGPPHPSQLLAIIGTAAGALEGLHTNGFVHGGLQPSAILRFSADNLARLGDMACAAEMGARGHPHPNLSYSAPETVGSERDIIIAASASDMWSLGCIVFELYTGLQIFDVQYSEAEVKDSLSEPSLLPWNLNPKFFDAIENSDARMMAESLLRWNPEERWDIHQVMHSPLLLEAQAVSRSRQPSGILDTHAALRSRQASGALKSDFSVELQPRQLALHLRLAASTMAATAGGQSSGQEGPPTPHVQQRRRHFRRRPERNGGSIFAASNRDLVLDTTRQSMDVLDPPNSGRQSAVRNPDHWVLDNPLWAPEEAGRAARQSAATPSSNPFSRVQEREEHGIQEVEVVQAEDAGFTCRSASEICNATGVAASSTRWRSPPPHKPSRRQRHEEIWEPVVTHSTWQSRLSSEGTSQEDHLENGSAELGSDRISARQPGEALMAGGGRLAAHNWREPPRFGSSDLDLHMPGSCFQELTEDPRRGAQEQSAPAATHQQRTQDGEKAEGQDDSAKHAQTAGSSWELLSMWGRFSVDAGAGVAPAVAQSAFQSPAVLTARTSSADQCDDEPSIEGSSTNVEPESLEHRIRDRKDGPANTRPAQKDIDREQLPISTDAEVLPPARQRQFAPAVEPGTGNSAFPDFVGALRATFRTGSFWPMNVPQHEALATADKETQLKRQRAQLGCSFTLQQVPLSSFRNLRGSGLVVSLTVEEPLQENLSRASILNALQAGGLSTKEVPLSSRSGLGDEPLFHVRLGGMYVLRVHLAMMNGAGRLPLIVEGVREVSLCAAKTGALETTMQVYESGSEPQKGIWEGCALWNTGVPAMALLVSELGQHNCLGVTVSLLAKGLPQVLFSLQKDLYVLMTPGGAAKRQQSAPLTFRRSPEFYETLEPFPWALESCRGTVSFAKVVRRAVSGRAEEEKAAAAAELHVQATRSSRDGNAESDKSDRIHCQA